jgi:crotonobetainyl-CoA:carnitine CoA-transferase CaiB-like acyl-CoA transferase
VGIGRPDVAALHLAPGDERARVLTEVRAILRTRTRDEWLAHFAGVDICLSPVNTLDEALADPHVLARGVVAREAGTTYITPPNADTRPAPALGADTETVLEEAGIDGAERARLRAHGVV